MFGQPSSKQVKFPSQNIVKQNLITCALICTCFAVCSKAQAAMIKVTVSNNAQLNGLPLRRYILLSQCKL